jgi:hypothetical protein
LEPAPVQDVAPPSPSRLQVRTANVCLLRLLERIAAAFNRAEVPLMALKGAALNLTIHDRPDQRPMTDLDLLIQPQHVETAFALLESVGCLRGRPLVREDFFPRFHYEAEFTAGNSFPMRVDLHVRPFRPLRWACLVPERAFWDRAERVRVGRAHVLIPGPEAMLIHLAAHSAIHGNSRPMWLDDLRHWVAARGGEIDWERFLTDVEAWGLTWPVRAALQQVQREGSGVVPPAVWGRLLAQRVGWRDRLALWQAPRDGAHPAAHITVDALCTPDWRVVLHYLWAVLVPDRGHMEEWYGSRHWGWLPWAHFLRLLGPLPRAWPRLRAHLTKIETHKSARHGLGVFATCDVRAGEIIARYRGKPAARDGIYVARYTEPDGTVRRVEITGKLQFLNHCCRPNAELGAKELRALRPIRAGDEITIDYGPDACDCRRRSAEWEMLAKSA